MNIIIMLLLLFDGFNIDNLVKLLGAVQGYVWPVIVLLVFFYLKQVIIEKLTNKDTSLEVHGPGFDFKIQNQLIEQNKPIGKEQEKVTEGIIEYEKESEKNIPTIHDVEKLKYELNLNKIYLEFERIYRIIFGSQIILLESLKKYQALEHQGVFYKFFEDYFLQVKNSNLFFQNNGNVDTYLNFLFVVGLIEVIREDPIKVYNLSQKGSAFLFYLDQQGYPKNKGL